MVKLSRKKKKKLLAGLGLFMAMSFCPLPASASVGTFSAVGEYHISDTKLQYVQDHLAMEFLQPKLIGCVSLSTLGWYFELEGATSHNGVPYKKYPKAQLYEKGIACFGVGDYAIYFHYGAKVAKFGDKDINNSVQVNIGNNTDIHWIKTASNINLYLLINQDASGMIGPTHALLGKRADGRFVKYFDTYAIKKQYFGGERAVYLSSYYRLQGDTIVIDYTRYRKTPEQQYGDYVKVGEFRFKWDKDTQWFGVEQVVY